MDDGSADASLSILKLFAGQDNRIKVVSFVRNFGKEAAMSAGIDFAKGDAAILIDADLQDPPKMILELLDQWKNGFDIVFARRQSREGEGFLALAWQQVLLLWAPSG